MLLQESENRAADPAGADDGDEWPLGARDRRRSTTYNGLATLRGQMASFFDGTAPASLRPVHAGRRRQRTMNKETLKGQWKQLKGHVRKQWGKLTDDDLDQIHGDAEILAGKIQERYGRAKDEAQREVDRFMKQADEQRP